MANGYFRLTGLDGGYGIKVFPPTQDGEPVKLKEVSEYLNGAQISYQEGLLIQAVSSGGEAFCPLGRGECPAINERYYFEVSEDLMEVRARFFAASSTGDRLTFDEVFRDLRGAGIVAGVQMEVLQEHFQSEGIYCTDLVIARGREPRHGKDGSVEYFFNTDRNTKPAVKEDGSVDFFDLNLLSPCRQGDMLAKIIPEDLGEEGINVKGIRISPKKVEKAVLRHGRNIKLSEDRLFITSEVDGHVTLVDGTVFVSDVYEVENVDTSTGNIEFAGSVQINGNVATNFVVKAGGNVNIKGVVEGAHIEAGGNIIIARGMNGMSRGTLKADGNIVAKFLESVTVDAGGYIHAEAIMHSKIKAGTDVEVTGKRGFIIGSHVRAGQKIDVKTLGADMGSSTVVEVGVDPKLKAKYLQTEKEVMLLVQEIHRIQTSVENFSKKRVAGERIPFDQKRIMKDSLLQLEEMRTRLREGHKRLIELQKEFSPGDKAVVIVRGEVYPYTTIVIDDVSTRTESSYHFCKFEKEAGYVRMCSL